MGAKGKLCSFRIILPIVRWRRYHLSDTLCFIASFFSWQIRQQLCFGRAKRAGRILLQLNHVHEFGRLSLHNRLRGLFHVTAVYPHKQQFEGLSQYHGRCWSRLLSFFSGSEYSAHSWNWEWRCVCCWCSQKFCGSSTASRVQWLECQEIGFEFENTCSWWEIEWNLIVVAS